MKKVLIITYYWPPSGGAGVQRWLKFVKYLRNFGWEPVVYTPENPEPPDYDETLFIDVPKNLRIIKTPIWEPYDAYKKLTGRQKESKITHGFLKETQKTGFAEKLAVWIRGNFFIPDARRFWINPSVRFLRNYLKQNPVDAIASTGPPHSMHLIALKLKQETGMPWLADFRDPWTGIDFFDKLRLSPPALRKHRQQERMVLQGADVVTTVNQQLAADLKALGAGNVSVITNGYDEDDFAFSHVVPEKDFVLTHLGSLNRDRNPEKLWEVLAEICRGNKSFATKLRLRFIGKVDYSLRESLKKNGLSDKTEFYNYLPHRQAIELASGSAVLLLLLNNTPNVIGITPGKMFEYLALRKPIFCVGPEDGNSASIINDSNSGITAGFDDAGAMKIHLESLFGHHLKGMNYFSFDGIERFSRKALTAQLAESLNKMLDL